MTLTGALADLLLPPVGLVTAGLAALALLRRRPLAGRLVAALALGALLVLALPATGMALLASLERGLELSPPAADPPKAIVVLGGDAVRVADPAQKMAIGPLSLDRARAAAALHRRLGLPILVSGGDPWGDGVAIATLMARSLADDFATPPRWVEAASADTWNNARLSAALLRADGIGSVYVVSQAWHLRRALIAFAHFGIAATPAPTTLDPWPSLRPDEFVPRVGAWVASFDALHEWVGCLYYTLRS